jgi:hypothetical protein
VTECSNGEVLGAATILPATSALTAFMFNKVHPLIVAGFVLANVIAMAVLLSRLARYFINRK